MKYFYYTASYNKGKGSTNACHIASALSTEGDTFPLVVAINYVANIVRQPVDTVIVDFVTEISEQNYHEYTQTMSVKTNLDIL